MEGSGMLFQRSTSKINLKTIEGACATLQLRYNRVKYQPIIKYYRGHMDIELQFLYREQTRTDVVISITGFLKGESIEKNNSKIILLFLN